MAVWEVPEMGPTPPLPLGSPPAEGWSQAAGIRITPAAMAAASFFPADLATGFPSARAANPSWFVSKQSSIRRLQRGWPIAVRGTSGIVPRGDAVEFLFCAKGPAATLSCRVGGGQERCRPCRFRDRERRLIRSGKEVEQEQEVDDKKEGAVGRRHGRCASIASSARALQRHRGFPAMHLPPFELVSAGALLLPSAIASHFAASPAGVALACLPIPMLFSVPQVSSGTWLANKRAMAFHRCCVVAVYVQGALTFMRFLEGDLIGGTYLAIQTAIGAYAIQPEGERYFPTYIMICGFNGILGLFQVLQMFQGTPLRFLPMLSVLPPVICLTAAYWGWQFSRELRAIARGQPNDGPVDSCWVRLTGGDWWPASALSPSPESGVGWGEGSNAGPGGSGPSGPGTGGGGGGQFNPFGGSGQRLGDS